MKNIVYLKRTGRSNQYHYWYWRKSCDAILRGRKLSKQLIEKNSKYSHHPDVKERECQVGDVVCYMPKMVFGTLIDDLENLYVARPVRGKIFRCRKESVELVSGNLFVKQQKKVTPNLLSLKTQEELDFAERLRSEAVERYIEKQLLGLPINEKTLKKLHKLLFAGIYHWAGCYREETIVVGRHNKPTLDWHEISQEIKSLFKKIKLYKNKKELIHFLTMFHQEMAWIHPFADGNGRVIRYMCDVIALKCGYQLNWSLEQPKKKKKFDGLARLIGNSLSELD